MNNEFSCPVGLWRRLAAIFYDSLLLLGVWFFAGALAQPLLPAEHIPLWYQLYLLTVAYLYFAWPWRITGQTLGMKAWRIKLLDRQGKTVSWSRAALRFFLAMLSWLCLGLGFWWSWWDGRRRTWHDLGSQSYIYSS